MHHGWDGPPLAHPQAEENHLHQGRQFSFSQEPVDPLSRSRLTLDDFSYMEHPATGQSPHAWSVTPNAPSPRTQQDTDELSAIHSCLGMPPRQRLQQLSHGFPSNSSYASNPGGGASWMGSRPGFEEPWYAEVSEEAATHTEHDMQQVGTRKRQRGPRVWGLDNRAVVKDKEDAPAYPAGEDPDWEPGQDDSPQYLPRPSRR